MKRLFAIWNQAYKVSYVVADDQVQALTLMAKRKLLRRADMFRKMQDHTDIATPEQQAILAGDVDGVLKQDAEGGWTLV